MDPRMREGWDRQLSWMLTTVSLPLVSTVFTPEAMALSLAAKIVRKNLVCDKYLVCSDSLSVLQEMKNVMTYGHLVHRVQREFHNLITGGFDVSFAWVPSHVGVEGNDRADAKAKRASQRAPEFIAIPYRNWFPELRKRTNELWTRHGEMRTEISLK